MVFYCISVPKFMFSEGLGLVLKVRFEFNEHNLYKSDKQF